MEFRKTKKSDIKDVMKIIKQAQKYFKEQEIDQWQNNYPNEDIINIDIENDESYVLLKDNEIIATTVISFNREKNYETIVDGKWLTDGEYEAIHRIAVTDKLKGYGISNKMIAYAESLCRNRKIKSIKVDTHRDNLSMQALLKKNNFKYCGIIFLEDGAERIAFEKVLG